MPFCPDCMTTYNETQSTCTNCNIDLLPDLAPAQDPESVEWYTVCSVPNQVAGYILKDVLEDEGIPVFLQCHGMSVYGGIKGHPGKSEWGDIHVPSNSVKRAQDCIKAYYDSIKED